MAEGLRRAWIREGVGCLLGGLWKKSWSKHWGLVWDKPFRGQTVSHSSLCQRATSSATQMASSSPHRSRDTASTLLTVPLWGNSAALPKHHPQSTLGKKENTVASILQKEKLIEGTGSASKCRADPPGFLTLRHFSWEHTIPHMLLMFSLQRMRILHFSAWETSFSQKQYVCYLYALVETKDILRWRKHFCSFVLPLSPFSVGCLLSLTHTFLLRLSYLLNAVQHRNSSSAWIVSYTWLSSFKHWQPLIRTTQPRASLFTTCHISC